MAHPNHTPYQDEDLNAGLAEERTHLAWRRSGLALLACGAVVLREVPGIPVQGGRPLVGVAILGIGAVAWGLGVWQARKRQRDFAAGRQVADARSLRIVAYGTAIVAAAAFLLSAFSSA